MGEFYYKYEIHYASFRSHLHTNKTIWLISPIKFARILRPGGVFRFSTNSDLCPKFWPDQKVYKSNPKSLLKYVQNPSIRLYYTLVVHEKMIYFFCCNIFSTGLGSKRRYITEKVICLLYHGFVLKIHDYTVTQSWAVIKKNNHDF